jgi:hypothetical protein
MHRALRATLASLALALVSSPVLAIQAENTRASGFKVLLWRSEAALDELTRSLGGMCVPRGQPELERALDEAGLDYLIFNAAGRDELHLERERESWRQPFRAWLEGRDPAHLRRIPCLADPATHARLRTTLRAVLDARAGPRSVGVSLGDEVGLTPGGAPHDVCQCEHCESAFANWSGRARRPWLASNGRALRLADIGTDATCGALARGDTAPLGPWLARREFHQDQLLELLARLERDVREHAPGVATGLLGISGRSAFAGVAVERALPLLDFAECYRVGDARELLFTLRRAEQSAWITLFRDERGPHASAWAAWEHWMRGGDGAVVWSDKELRAEPQLAERLKRALARIDALDRELPHFEPSPRGVALVHSARSLSAAWLREAVVDGPSWPNRFPSWQEKHGAYESARNAWLAQLDDAGAQAGSLPSERLDAATAQRFRVLVASHWLVVDDNELERLERYLAAGGTLLVSGEFGWIDSSGRKRAEDTLAKLEARLPGRIVRAERNAASYQSAPFDAASVERTRTFLAAHEVELAPWRIEGRRRPWIETWSTDTESGAPSSIGALLPRLNDAARFEWPESLTLSVAATERVELLHPAPQSARLRETLDGARRVYSLVPAPGDAVVLRVRRAD